MILAVNIGNTNVRAAIGETETVSEVIVSGDDFARGGSFVNLLEEGFGADLWQRLEGSIIASVVPKRTPVVIQAILNKTGIPPKRIDARHCGGLSVRRYNGPLGEDRAVCCAGALFKYEPPLAVIDFGTATTINIVGAGGEFLGGAILAGVRIGLRALEVRTALLPRVGEMMVNAPLLGRSTMESLVTGAVIGAACSAEGYIRRVENELGYGLSVVITGGHATMVLPYCEFEYTHEPNLLANSLFALYNQQRRS